MLLCLRVVLYGKGGGRGLAPTHNIIFKPYINIPCNIYISRGKNVGIYIMWARGFEPATHNNVCTGFVMCYALY
jgi:hypothetical protein